VNDRRLSVQSLALRTKDREKVEHCSLWGNESRRSHPVVEVDRIPVIETVGSDRIGCVEGGNQRKFFRGGWKGRGMGLQQNAGLERVSASRECRGATNPLFDVSARIARTGLSVSVMSVYDSVMLWIIRSSVQISFAIPFSLAGKPR
jgi:hypothetical protein